MRKTLFVVIIAVLISCFLIGCTFSPVVTVKIPNESIEEQNATEIDDQPKTLTPSNSTIDSTKKSNKLSQEELKAQDEMFLQYYYEMTLDDEFKDNIIVVIFKYTYTGNLGLKYFEKLSVDTEVISIYDSLTRKTVTKESEGFFSSYIIMANRDSRLVTLTLSTHDKNIVLETAKEIMSWDEVLIAIPDPIIYYVFPEDVNNIYPFNPGD